MPLVPMTHLLAEGRGGEYAVCYCEAWNLESLQAVVEAAEEAGSPVITGFNGGFLCHPERSKPENLAYYAGMVLALREATVPLAFLLNETDDFSQIEQGIRMGFNAVMVENQRLEPEEYRALVRRTVRLAHAAGAAVEAAVGHLPDASGENRGNAETTDPGTARAFVEDTGIDALGVSVGNVHILTRGKAAIDLDALARIRGAVQVPLVLHGGTGIPPEQIPACIRLGVAKVNFGTALKQAYLAAVQEELARYHEPLSPHPFVGVGGAQDILMAGREAVKQKARELMTQCGSVGTAEFLAKPGRTRRSNKMISQEQYRTAVERSVAMLEQAGFVITPAERDRVEVADFGLEELEKTGLQIITYVNTERVCAKELIMFPHQTCPEHWHPNVAERLGKEETFRCRWGAVYLYVPGTETLNPSCHPPARSDAHYTVWHEVVLKPGEQYTLSPNTRHWFQAGPEGAIVSEFSTRSTDEEDLFTDPRIKRAPEVG